MTSAQMWGSITSEPNKRLVPNDVVGRITDEPIQAMVDEYEPLEKTNQTVPNKPTRGCSGRGIVTIVKNLEGLHTLTCRQLAGRDLSKVKL